LSEASKKRIPPHPHLSYQIKEAEEETFSPQPRGVHSRDIIVNRFVTLSETLIDWLRKFEAENSEFIASWASVVSDANASNNEAVKVPSTVTSTGDILRFVDDADLGLAGNLYFVVRMKVASNVSSTDIARIQVYDSAGLTVLAQWTVAPNDFPNSNEYHHFACGFELPRSLTSIELKVILLATGITDLYIDFAGLVPKSMPIGYADVTVLTTDPGTDAATTDPLTDAAGNVTGLSVDIAYPATDAASNVTGLSVDQEDPLTDALTADGMGYSNLFSKSITDKAIGTTRTTIFTVAPVATANTIPLTLFRIQFRDPDGSAQLHIEVEWSWDGSLYYPGIAISQYV